MNAGGRGPPVNFCPGPTKTIDTPLVLELADIEFLLLGQCLSIDPLFRHVLTAQEWLHADHLYSCTQNWSNVDSISLNRAEIVPKGVHCVQVGADWSQICITAELQSALTAVTLRFTIKTFWWDVFVHQFVPELRQTPRRAFKQDELPVCFTATP